MVRVNNTFLSVRNLQISFPTDYGTVHVVDDVSFDVADGETLGIVGESGSGKSMTSLALLGLVPRPGSITAGEISFESCELTKLSEGSCARCAGPGSRWFFRIR